MKFFITERTLKFTIYIKTWLKLICSCVLETNPEIVKIAQGELQDLDCGCYSPPMLNNEESKFDVPDSSLPYATSAQYSLLLPKQNTFVSKNVSFFHFLF